MINLYNDCLKLHKILVNLSNCLLESLDTNGNTSILRSFRGLINENDFDSDTDSLQFSVFHEQCAKFNNCFEFLFIYDASTKTGGYGRHLV